MPRPDAVSCVFCQSRIIIQSAADSAGVPLGDEPRQPDHLCNISGGLEVTHVLGQVVEDDPPSPQRKCTDALEQQGLGKCLHMFIDPSCISIWNSPTTLSSFESPKP